VRRDKPTPPRDTGVMSLALRPSWAVDLPCASREVVARLAADLGDGRLTFKRSRIPGGGVEHAERDDDHFLLSVPAGEQRVWSPWLAIDVSARDGGAHVFARFGPHPSVWTGFAFGYLTLTVGLVVALVVAASGAAVKGGDQTWALWLAAGLALAGAGLWGLSQLGQRLGAAQMESLRSAFDRALSDCRAAAAAAAPR
jgi:hypothetical protein